MQRQWVCFSVLLVLVGCIFPVCAQQAGSDAVPSVQGTSPSPQVAQKLPPTVHGNGVIGFIPVWTDTKVIGESIMAQDGSTIDVAGSVNATGNVNTAGNVTAAGNVFATGSVTTIGNLGIGTGAASNINLDVFSSTPGIHAPMGRFGSNTATDSNSILTYNGSGGTEMFEVGCANCFVPGSLVGDGGLRVARGTHILFGDSGASRLILDGSGNADQVRTGGGMVKAMISYFGGSSSIDKCFNSALFGAAATKPPCGFGTDKTGAGDYIFDFGFEVDDRIFSISQTLFANADTLVVCYGAHNCSTQALTPNQVEVSTRKGGSFADADFMLVVY